MKRQELKPDPAPMHVGSGQETFPPGWEAPRHAHSNVWELVLVTQGAMRVSVEGKETTSSVGSIYIYPPHIVHQEFCISSVALQMRGIMWKGPKNPATKLPLEMFDSTGHIGNAMAWLEELQNNVGPRRWLLNNVLEGILFECSLFHQKSREDRFAQIRRHIEQNLAEPITVRQLAKVVSMSEGHFAHAFQHATGLSPMSYVRKIRLEHATKALRETNTVLREIARQVGFRDEFGFSRMFRRVMGISPGSLRRRN